MKLKYFPVLFALLLIGCSKKNEKFYYDLGADNNKKENYQEAVKNYDLQVKNFPESRYTPTALYNLGIIFNNQKIKLLSEQQSYDKAMGYFKQLYENYPKSKEAPQALFMMGFMYENQMQKQDDARTIYKKFLNEYPNNELAPMVKAELDNLGLSPEEIIKRNPKNK